MIMTIPHSKKATGSVLVLTLVTTAILGIGLASYLTLVRAQNLSVMRSLAWNSCIPVLEAGIEEAMTHINRSGLANLESSGWVLTSAGYKKTRFIGDSYFVATISPDNPPDIISEGFVPVPLSSAAPLVFVASVVAAEPLAHYVKRRVRVTTRRESLWTKAMVAKGNIDLMGNNVQTDSFDSEDPDHSENGRYPGINSSKRKAGGDVATNSDLVNSLNVGNAEIFGRVATGPLGSVSIGPQGSVGDLAWHAGNNRGIKPGWSANDMNVLFAEILRPYNSGFDPQSGTVDGTTYKYVLSGGNYMMSNLSMAGNDVMYVERDSVLLVTGSISITGNANIEIAHGASLRLYMEGASASVGGNGLVNNNSSALSFIYFGLKSNTSLALSGNAAFTGAIYAPYAAFTMGGGGNNTYDFVGSSVSDTVKMNGHFNFHYDEALGRAQWTRGFVVDSWNEL
jgi:hypothetical protein